MVHGEVVDSRTREATRLWTLAVPTVSAFVTSPVRDFQDRDDVLQETAVAVLDAFDRYDPSQRFVAWAIGVARNQVRLYCRRKARERLAFDSEAVEALAHAFGEGDPKDRRLDYLGECVQTLEARSKELCRLRYEQGLKPAAIAESDQHGSERRGQDPAAIRDRLRECVEHRSAGAGT